ncbi:MAG: hypothetical protein KA777_04565, partial [Rhodoferax sp.]|nr:hypothetical protein [Rhodoferax sp.]
FILASVNSLCRSKVNWWRFSDIQATKKKNRPGTGPGGLCQARSKTGWPALHSQSNYMLSIIT